MQRTVTSARSLQGLMKWLTRAEWRDRFAEVYDHHLLPACRRTGLDAEEVMEILGESWFMTTVWGGAFEDFLTREGADGRNIVDDYLKRRGWKESASTRAYMSIIANLGDEPLRGQRYSPRHVVSGAGPCARGRSNSDQRKVGNALPQTVGPHRHACYSGRIADAYQRGRVAVRPRCRVPIEGAAGLGYVLRPGFDLPPLMFTAEELDAVALGAQLVRRTRDAKLQAAADRVLTKVLAALVPRLGDDPRHWPGLCQEAAKRLQREGVRRHRGGA